MTSWQLPDSLCARYEVAETLGLTEKLRRVGWGGLSARENGCIGGQMRGKNQHRQGKTCIQDLQRSTTR